MNRTKLEIVLIFVVIACLSFILGLYFRPSFFASKPSEKARLAPDVVSRGIENPYVPNDMPPPSEALTNMQELPSSLPGVGAEPSPEPKPAPFIAPRVLGFIKEIKSNSIVLDFLTSQYPGAEEKRLQREFLVSEDTKITLFQSFTEPPIPSNGGVADQENSPEKGGSEKPKSTVMAGVIIQNEAGEQEKFTLNSTASLKDLRVGDYGFVVSDVDLNSATLVTAKEIRIYPLENNPYLKGEFTSYEGLPLANDKGY